MVEHTKVFRKTTIEDKIAICPILGCKMIKRVKPLKFGFIGFGKYPKCKQHHLPLLFVDERIGEIVNASLACLFDKSGLPPKTLLNQIKEKFPKELNTFIESWVYCITIGRGAPIISSYMDSLSNSYLKQLTKKQIKILKDNTSIKSGRKKGKVFDAIKRGIDEITLQYTRLLKHLRAHSEVLVNVQEIFPLSTELKNIINKWLKISLREETVLLKIEEKQDIPLSQVKEYYDKILNIGTCRCLIGLPPDDYKKKRISAFDRFSVYLEFWEEHLTKKFTKSDIYALKNTKLRNANSSSILTIKKDNPIYTKKFTIQISRSEVELQWYESIKRSFEKLYPILFEKVDIILNNMINSHRFPLYLDEFRPKFAKKYLYIYEYQDPITKKKIIKDFITRDLVGDRIFEETLEKKAYGAIIYRWRFLDKSNFNKYYLGITVEREETRFAQHIVDSIIRYSTDKSMTKKSVVIIQALKTLGFTDEDFDYYYSQVYTKKFYEMGDAVMPLVKKCETLFEREILEIHKSRSTAIYKEKQYTEGLIDGINYKIDGLNEIHGGSGGLGINLPMYDVSMMITFGFQYKTIKEYLLKFYNLEVSIRQIKKRISSHFSGDYNKGSRYIANEEFLKPVVEILLYEQFLSRLDEKQYLKILEFLKTIFIREDTLKLKTWFWSFYRGDLDLDFLYWENIIKENHKIAFREWSIKNKRYYGILRTTWVDWIIKRKLLKEIIKQTKLSRKQVKRVRTILNSKEILNKFQRYITIKYRKDGIPWKTIYKDKLNYTDFRKYGPDFFERMFQIQFQRLKFEKFSEIDLNQISKWNNIDFSDFV